MYILCWVERRGEERRGTNSQPALTREATLLQQHVILQVILNDFLQEYLKEIIVLINCLLYNDPLYEVSLLFHPVAHIDATLISICYGEHLRIRLMFIVNFPFILCLLFWATTHAYNYMYLLKMETSRIFIEMVVLKINHYLYNFGHIIHHKRTRELVSVSIVWTKTGIVPHEHFHYNT